MQRSILAILMALGVALGSVLGPGPTALAQCSFAPGAVVQLAGTPHLFIVDDQGVLHWGGDTRGLAGHTIAWDQRCDVGLDVLRAVRRGDPWLSAGLPKIGDGIYLAKWETTDPAPFLLHIQSLADLELFGINEANYQSFVLDRTAWQQRFGFDPGMLTVGPLPAAASFAWSEGDRAAYNQLLWAMMQAESSAMQRASQSGADVATVLPAVTSCEQQGLADFDRNRNGEAAFGIAQACIARSTGVAPAQAGPGAPGTPMGAPPSGVTASSAPAAGSPGAPVAPSGVRISALQGTGVRIDWSDASPNEDGFRILRGGQPIAVVGANATSFVDTAFNPASPACYTVVAFNSAGEGPSGQACPAVLLARPPSAPTRVYVVIQQGFAGTRVYWTDTSNNEDGFRVVRNGIPIATVDPNVRNYRDDDVDWNSTPCYLIVAFNSAGEAPSRQFCPGDYL